MAFKIAEEFEVQAPVQRVWEYLIDPAKVAVCIPGAELLESKDDGTFIGAVKVKVGPMSMSYKGTVKFTELDEQAHQVRLVGEGREAGGAGSAKMTMSQSCHAACKWWLAGCRQCRSRPRRQDRSVRSRYD